MLSAHRNPRRSGFSFLRFGTPTLRIRVKMSILAKQHPLGKTGVSGAAAGRSAKAAIPLIYLFVQSLTSGRHRRWIDNSGRCFRGIIP
jgi:hypothetical protein